MPTLRATLVLSILCLTAAVAAAEPWHRNGPYLQLSAGPAVGWLARTTTYTDTDSGDASSVRPMSGRGAGVQLGVTGGFDLGNGVRVGGFARYGLLRIGLPSSFSSDVTRTSVQRLIVGPSVTLHESRGLHLRADAGTGSMFHGSAAGAYRLSTTPFGTFEIGGEVGYQRAVRAGWRVEGALALAATWGRSHEEGDHGYYDDRARVVTAALLVSFTRTAR